MTGKKKTLLTIGLIFLIFVFTPIFGKIYEMILGPASSGFFWGFANPENVPGFFMSYLFFVTLIFTLFSDRQKFKVLIILLAPVLLLDLFSGDIEVLILDLGVVLVGFILAKIILMIYQKVKK